MQKRPLFLAAVSFWLLLLLFHRLFPQSCEPGPVTQQLADRGGQVELIGEVLRYEKKNNSAGYLLSSCALADPAGNQFLDDNIYLYLDDHTIPLGSVLAVKGRLSPLSRCRNFGQFDSFSYYRQKGAGAVLFGKSFEILSENRSFSLRETARRLRGRLASCLHELCMAGAFPDAEAVLAAMLLGDKTELDSGIQSLFQTGGFLHVLTVSGMHLTILGMGLFHFLRRLFLPEKAAALLALAAMCFYIFLAGAGTATVRAGIMFAVLLMGRVVGRSYDPPTGLGAAILFLLCSNPGLAENSSFQLSVMATMGAAVFAPMFTAETEEEQEEKRSSLKRRKHYRLERWREALLQNLKFALILNAALLPLTLWYFYELPLFSLLSSLFLLPSVAWVLLSAVTGLGAVWFFPFLSFQAGSRLLLPASFLLRFYFAFLHLLAKLPGASLVLGRPALWQVLLYYLLFLLLAIGSREQALGKLRFPRKGIVFMLPLLGLLLLRLPQSSFSVTMLDVGQGDCILIQEPGTACLIDGGSSDQKNCGQYVIDPCLRARGIGRLDAVFLSHSDADHINGVEELITEILKGETSLRIGRLFLPVWMPETESGQRLLGLCGQAGIQVSLLERGDRVTIGGSTYAVLYPLSVELDSGWKEDPNRGSMVLRLENRGFRALFTGDLPESEEAKLGGNLSCDLLKVGHHGSATSTGEDFLDQTEPAIAMFSCGAGNRYGHPDPGTVERIQGRGIRLYGTVQSGELTFSRKFGRYYMQGMIDSDCFSVLQ